MDYVASFIEHYLPVFIPVFLTIISVLSGIVTKRIQLRRDNLLKIHSDIVLGLFSFVIWALVAYQQTGSIQLNKDLQLSLIRVVLLLFANIILLIAGQIVLNIPWGDMKTEENFVNGLFLLVTVLAVFAPIGLAVPIKVPAKEAGGTAYRVSVVYQDASLPKAGPNKLIGLQLCDVLPVDANDKQTAIKKAIDDFNASDKAKPAKAGSKGTVFINQDQIVAEAEPQSEPHN
jgi:hypothetical protein